MQAKLAGKLNDLNDVGTTPKRASLNGLSDGFFEILLITIVLATTLVAHYMLNIAPVILHFLYLPMLIAAYYFGRTVACCTALLSFLAVAISAIIEPTHYLDGNQSQTVAVLGLCAWGGFLGINAIVIGSMCDERNAQVRELRQAYMGIIEVLSKYLQAADQYTKSHSQRVADLAERIALEMGVKQAEIENIRVGSLLHDIGKVEISTRLIQKAADLTPAEKAEIDTHTVRGAELVRSLGSILEGSVPIIMHHHDHYTAESKGEGLHGDDIPLGARIVAVADAFDAIVTDRPYRRGRTPDEAITIIKEASGFQFDPEVVKAFERVVHPFLASAESHAAAALNVD